MSAAPIQLARAGATLLALITAWALWELSASVMGWIGLPVLLPLVRLGVVIGGLSLAEALYAAIVRRGAEETGGPQASSGSEGREI